MIGKNFKFDGVSIPYTAQEGRDAGWYADIKWTGLSVRNTIVPRQDWHGAYARPTLAEGKLIQISGEIFSTSKTSRGTAKNIIANLFKLEDFPLNGSDFKALDFYDDDGVQWTIQAKVYAMPEYEHERGEPVITFFCQLYAQDPLLRSKSLQTESGIYGNIQGLTFPVQFPVQFIGLLNPVQCENEGNFAASTRVTITGEIVNPRVFNYTNGQYFQVNVTLSGADELIIDSGNGTVTLNGINILSDRAEGSNWVFLDGGVNQIMLLGDDFDPDDQGKAQIQVEWYHTKIA